MTDKLKTRRIKWVITLITFVAMIGLAYAVRTQLVDTLNNLRIVNVYIVFLMIPLEVYNYYAQANLYQGLFRILGDKFRLRALFKLSLELNFVNTVFPSGGVSGFSYLSLRMRSEDISTAKATLVQMMRFILIFVSFQILLLTGLIMLAIGGDVNNLTILVASSLITLLLVGTFILAYVIGSKQRIDSFFTFITRAFNRIIHVVRPKHPETINIARARNTFGELHENYMHIRRNFSVLKKPLIYALLANLSEVAVIYVVYIAFGQIVNPGAVIIAYAIANFAGLISVLPGGVGIYEALMTAVLAAGGVPPSVSLPVTVMYRVLNMIVQLGPGYVLYQRALHERSDG